MILDKLKKLPAKERQLFINLIDEQLFNRSVGPERLDAIIVLMSRANCSEEEIKALLQPKIN
jgi:hypothetical protein